MVASWNRGLITSGSELDIGKLALVFPFYSKDNSPDFTPDFIKTAGYKKATHNRLRTPLRFSSDGEAMGMVCERAIFTIMNDDKKYLTLPLVPQTPTNNIYPAASEQITEEQIAAQEERARRSASAFKKMEAEINLEQRRQQQDMLLEECEQPMSFIDWMDGFWKKQQQQLKQQLEQQQQLKQQLEQQQQATIKVKEEKV
jgi:hypothetical protein